MKLKHVPTYDFFDSREIWTYLNAITSVGVLTGLYNPYVTVINDDVVFYYFTYYLLWYNRVLHGFYN